MRALAQRSIGNSQAPVVEESQYNKARSNCLIKGEFDRWGGLYSYIQTREIQPRQPVLPLSCSKKEDILQYRYFSTPH